MIALILALAVQIPTTAEAFGRRPESTRIPLIQTRDSFRASTVVIALGDKSYHAAIQTTRVQGDWAVSFLEAGRRPVNFETAVLVSALRRRARETDFGGRSYSVSADDEGSAILLTPADGVGETQRLALAELKQAAWDAAVPLPALGPEWRMIFQIDLFQGAGMRSFSFLKNDGREISFYRFGAEAVDHTRSVYRDLPGVRIGLRIEGEDELVVTPVLAE